jgi:hypothetical protein
MLGQLQNAGNTTTLAHYLELLSSAGMLTGLPKFSGKKVRQRGSSPKLQVLNTALMTAQSGIGFEAALEDREFFGRLVESSVGAHLINSVMGTNAEVFYWRDRNLEVDFVLRKAKSIVGIEVKSGTRKTYMSGMQAFSNAVHPKRSLLVGRSGIPLEDFLMTPARSWLE